MAYDESLAERVRELALDEPPMIEKKMFGGAGFMLDGNLAVVVSHKGGLMVRINRDDTVRFTMAPGVELMEMKGRQMNGWIYVEPAQLESDETLSEWLSVGVDFAASLPPK